MKSVPVWIYLTIPAVGYFAQSFVKPEQFALAVELSYFLPNYLFFVVPQLLVLIITKFLHTRLILVHAGLIGATLVFVTVWITGVFVYPFGNALEWLWYWPCAIAGSLLFIGMSTTWLATKGPPR